MSSTSLPSPLPAPHPAPLPLSSFSSLTLCPELDLSVTLSPAPKVKHTHPKPCSRKTSERTHLKHREGQTRRKENMQVCFEEPIVISVTPDQSSDALPQEPVRGQRRSRGCPHAPRQLVKPPAAVANLDPGYLEKAGLNTTLALKAELQSLQGVEFNSQKAIKETLRRSERTKNLINTRATEEVNVSRSQLLFTSLVGVNVQENQLNSQMLQPRPTLLPSPADHGTKAADGPSLFLFMTSDHLRQKPVPLEEEPVNCKPCPSPRPALSTFDLYRRGRY